MIGLYPASNEPESPVEDGLAKTLLRRLGLPEVAAPVTKDSADLQVVASDAVE
jgi:hypothetical protein